MADYRQYQIGQKPNVETYLDSDLDADSIIEFGFEHVCIATGAKWRRDGVGRQHVAPIVIDSAMPLFTPDCIMDGRFPTGRVVIYDDDHYYIGGVLAELLRSRGCEVTIVTTSPYLSEWTRNTLEQSKIHSRLAELGIEIILNRGVVEVARSHIVSNCIYTGSILEFPCEAVLMVTSRQECNGVYLELKERSAEWDDSGIRSVRIIGDAEAPGPIAWATYAGHRYARELDGEDIGDDLPFRREITELEVG